MRRSGEGQERYEYGDRMGSYWIEPAVLAANPFLFQTNCIMQMHFVGILYDWAMSIQPLLLCPNIASQLSNGSLVKLHLKRHVLHVPRLKVIRLLCNVDVQAYV
ncbi:hypothetical protein ACLOJK_011411 [Asimina triloba]